MRILNLYLLGYFLLIFGALIALWYGDVLPLLPATWLVIGLVLATGFGLLLAVAFRRS